jgi:hypothetical protein
MIPYTLAGDSLRGGGAANFIGGEDFTKARIIKSEMARTTLIITARLKNFFIG